MVLDVNFGERLTVDQPPTPRKKCAQSNKPGNGNKAAAGKIGRSQRQKKKVKRQ